MDPDFALNDQEHAVAVVALLDDGIPGRIDHLFGDPGDVTELPWRHAREEGDIPEEEYSLDCDHGSIEPAL